MTKIKKIAVALFIVVNFYAILCGGIYFFQEYLIFHPKQLPLNYEFTFKTPFTEVTLDAPDGAKLHGLHFKVQNPKQTLLYFHGNAGNLNRWGEIVQYFVAKNIEVIVMDYRGFGKSTGIRTAQLLYTDSELWYAYAVEAAARSASPLWIYGRSLGTTFATHVAGQHHAGQLILETPFVSIENEAKSRFPFLPIGKLLNYKFDTSAIINKVNIPISIIHGTNDRVVDYSHGKALFTAIKQPSKSFYTIPKGGHKNLVNYPEFHRAIDTIFRIK